MMDVHGEIRFYVLTSRLAVFSMSKWVATPKPSADLTELPDLARTDPDGTKVRLFQTRFGKRFAEIVAPNGFIVWLQEVPAA
jgi:hypothetical protein